MPCDPEHDSIVADINLTPLIDVFLVMVVIFMVSALAVQAERCEKPPKPSALDVRLPAGDRHEFDASQPSLVIDIPLAGGTYIGGHAMTDGELANVLAAAAARKPKPHVIVRADRGVSHGRVVDVMERARRAGLADIAIATAATR